MILCSGCFDGIHSGHVAYLEAAAKHLRAWEHLVVAVAPDDYIREVKQRTPRWTHSHRVEAVQGMKHVWLAVRQVEKSVAWTIARMRPRVFVKGKDWMGDLPTDVQLACLAAGTRVQFTETDRIHSSEAFWTR